MGIRAVFALCVLAVCATPLAAQRSQMQYRYDDAKSALTIVDIQCPSASRGVAVGVIKQAGRLKPVALVTSDGGARWQTVPLEEPPVSLFFLNESLGWMVTEKGLWRTVEAGRSWVKLPDPRAPSPGGSINLNAAGLRVLHNSRAPLLRVRFADENKGWAVRRNNTMIETRDGGKTWKPGAGLAPIERDPSSLYRGENFQASAVWTTPQGVHYLAGVTATSPHKVRVLMSRDLKEWTPIDVDDRAVAKRAMLAGAGEDLWLATDNGMILKLTPSH